MDIEKLVSSVLNRSHGLLYLIFKTSVMTFSSVYSSPPVSAGDTFQDLPQMPETVDSSEPYI
jgi:hypothetical protein